MAKCLMVCNPSMNQTWHIWAHTGITEASLLRDSEDGGGVLGSRDWKCACLDLKVTWVCKNKSLVVRCKCEAITENECEPCQVCPSGHLPTWNRYSHGTEFHKSLHSKFLPEFVIVSWFLLYQTSVIDLSHEKPMYIYDIIVLCWASVIETDCILY